MGLAIVFIFKAIGGSFCICDAYDDAYNNVTSLVYVYESVKSEADFANSHLWKSSVEVFLRPIKSVICGEFFITTLICITFTRNNLSNIQ